MSTIATHPVEEGRTDRSRSWADSRLRLGQLNVGSWVLVSVAVCLLQPRLPEGDLATAIGAWGGAVALYMLGQLPFDFVGGYQLPARYGRLAPGSSWLERWLTGAVVHGGALLASGAVALALGTWFGTWAAFAGLVLLSGLLVGQQGAITALIARRAPVAPTDLGTRSALTWAGIDLDRVDVLHTEDRGFVGGWVGPRGLERLVLPAHWTGTLPEPVLGAILLRRRLALRSGLRARGVIGAVVFNGVGMALVLSLVPGAGFQSATALLVAVAGFTLWSFLGLLTLPTISRHGVFALDRMAAEQLGDPEPLVRAIRLLDRDQEDEPHRGPWVETVFHPVPAPEARVEALRSRSPIGHPVAWRVARMALVTSWAYGSWLSRAVHCNSGRPVLWALPPGD